MSVLSVSNYSYRSDPILKSPSLDLLSQKTIQAAHSNWFSRSAAFSSLEREFTAITPEQLKIVLQRMAEERDGKEILEGLAQILPREKMEEALQMKGVDSAKDMANEAVDYLEKIRERPYRTLSARLSSSIDTAQSILESFLNAFGIAEFFKPPESKSDAKIKAQTMMMLLQFSILLSTLALPVFGPGTAGIVVGSIFLSIWTLSLLYPYIRSAPSHLLHAENWTRQCQLGTLSAGAGRKQAVDEIARTLIGNRSMKMHPLLLGKTGIGKTETAKAFVEAIEKGKYPDLKGKRVFYINTADLIDKEEGTKLLARINEAMGRHRKNIILIFDEIHIACQKRENSVLGDQLKTLLDVGTDNFQYVIGITTEEEFYRDIYANNPAFARRFKRIAIDQTTPTETIQILHNALLKQAPKILLAPDAFETLLRKTKEAFGEEEAQPAASIKVLSLCIKKTAETQKSPLEIKIENIRNQIDAQHAQHAQRKKEKGVIAALEKQLQELGTLLLQEKSGPRPALSGSGSSGRDQKRDVSNCFKSCGKRKESRKQPIPPLRPISHPCLGGKDPQRRRAARSQNGHRCRSHR